MDSITPQPDCEDVYHGEEVSVEFFEPGCQPSHILHLAEEPLDDISHGIEIYVMWDWLSGI